MKLNEVRTYYLSFLPITELFHHFIAIECYASFVLFASIIIIIILHTDWMRNAYSMPAEIVGVLLAFLIQSVRWVQSLYMVKSMAGQTLALDIALPGQSISQGERVGGEGERERGRERERERKRRRKTGREREGGRGGERDRERERDVEYKFFIFNRNDECLGTF